MASSSCAAPRRAARSAATISVSTDRPWSLAGAAESGSDQPYIGHRNDGTGVFPADCQPVSRWSEYDFVEEEFTDDGKEVMLLVPKEDLARAQELVGKAEAAGSIPELKR